MANWEQHLLPGVRGSDMVSVRLCSRWKALLTSWRWGEAATWSVWSFAITQEHHLQAEGEDRRQHGQHEVVDQIKGITYTLGWEEAVIASAWAYDKLRTSSLTSWGSEVAMWSAWSCMANWDCHLLPEAEGRQWHDQGEVVCQIKNGTYILGWADAMPWSAWSCGMSQEHHLLAKFKKWMVTWSGWGCAANREHHLQTGGERRQQWQCG